MTATVADLLAGIATQVIERFADRNARVRGSSVVHAVHTERWLADIEVPAPACRVGVAGWDLSALVPTTDAVTCVRCLRTGAAGALHRVPMQLAFWP